MFGIEILIPKKYSELFEAIVEQSDCKITGKGEVDKNRLPDLYRTNVFVYSVESVLSRNFFELGKSYQGHIMEIKEKP